MPGPTFEVLSERLTRALVNGDFEVYRTVFAIPHFVKAGQSKPYVIATDAELKKDFELYRKSITANQVTDIFRQVKDVEFTTSGDINVLCEVTLLHHAQRIVEPFATKFTIRRDKDVTWRIAGVESTIGHIRWTLGYATVATSGQFVLKPEGKVGEDFDD